VKHEQIALIVWKRDKVAKSYLGGYYDKSSGSITEMSAIPLSLVKSTGVLLSKLSEPEITIAEYLIQQKFSDMSSFDIFRGLPRNLKTERGEICIKGKEIGRYFIRLPQGFVDLSSVNDNRILRLKKRKIIAQRIVAHVTQPFDRIIMAFPDLRGYLTFETVTNIVPEDDDVIKPLALILNSRFVCWFVYSMIYNKAIRDMDFDAYFVKRILLPDYKTKTKCLNTLCDHLSFLNTDEHMRQSFAEMIEFFDRQIVDSLVYELYFGEIIHKPEDIVRFFEENSTFFDNLFREIFKKTPKYAQFYMQNKSKLINLVKSVLEILKTLSFESYEKIEEWITDSETELKYCKMALKDEDYEKALYQLCLSVEKLVKAYALYFGLFKELELKKIGHSPIKAYIRLLDETWVSSVRQFFNLKIDMSKSLNQLEKLAKIKIESDVEKIRELDKGVPIFLRIYDSTKKKLNKSFSDKETKMLAELIRPYKDIENFYYVMLGFSELLLPISAIVSTFYQPSKYPDERRKISDALSSFEIVKSMDVIIQEIEDNIKLFRLLIKEDKEKKQNLYLVLFSLIELYLKPINYDRWAELYWKKQIEGNLKPEEEKELEDLENENLKTSVYSPFSS